MLWLIIRKEKCSLIQLSSFAARINLFNRTDISSFVQTTFCLSARPLNEIKISFIAFFSEPSSQNPQSATSPVSSSHGINSPYSETHKLPASLKNFSAPGVFSFFSPPIFSKFFFKKPVFSWFAIFRKRTKYAISSTLIFSYLFFSTLLPGKSFFVVRFYYFRVGKYYFRYQKCRKVKFPCRNTV